MVTHHRHFPRNTIPLSVTVEAWFLLGSIALATWMVSSDIIPSFVVWVSQFGIIGSFIEGFFFTSIFTAVPAFVAIYQSATYVPMWELSIVGGFGAVCGDLLVFRFVRSRLVERILGVGLSPKVLGFGYWLTSGSLWWIGPVAGAIVIASPLPDEIGLVMMGLSHIRMREFLPIAFVANAVGIFLIVLAAQNLS